MCGVCVCVWRGGGGGHGCLSVCQCGSVEVLCSFIRVMSQCVYNLSFCFILFHSVSIKLEHRVDNGSDNEENGCQRV